MMGCISPKPHCLIIIVDSSVDICSKDKEKIDSRLSLNMKAL